MMPMWTSEAWNGIFGVAASGSPSRRIMINTLLNIHNVYILDCFLDVFVWFGIHLTRLVRAFQYDRPA